MTISISVTTKDETLRYGPFVQAFNIALDMLADLDVPLNPSNEIIFHRNDPKAITGHDTAESGHQPDVVLGNEQALRLGHEDGEDLTNEIRPSLPFSWNHVLSCYEFKATSTAMEKPPPAYTYSPCPGTVTMPDIPTDIYEFTTPTSSTPSSSVPSLSEFFWPFSVTCTSWCFFLSL